MGTVVLRAARADEAARLGETALRSKGYWGYDADFLAACRAELTFRSEEVAARRIVVADAPAGIAGFYSLDGDPPEGELGNLWVVPEHIGTGLGRRLWNHAVTAAGAAGYRTLRIEADPNAVGFYQAMGAKQVGEVPSGSIPGRTLPLLSFTLGRAGRSSPIPPPAAPLTDGTVSLRCRRASDLDAIYAASRDPETQRWLSDPPMDAAAHAASMTRVAAAFQTGRSAPLVIAESATGEPVGLLNVQFRDDRVATIAYSVFPAHRGQGVAPRAVRLAADWGFSALGLAELLLEIDPGNIASLRVAEKCGFTPAGHAQGEDDGSGKLVFAARRG